MYIPPDLSKYNNRGVPFSQFLATNIYPVQVTDPNSIFRVDKQEFQFTYLDSIYEPDVSIRIARTPLSSKDPSTYAALSKFTEYNLRKYHSSTGAQASNQLDKPPLMVPKELIGSQSDGKSEILLMGALINPLIADSYKPVHLIPGCISGIVNFSKSASSQESSTTFGNKLFGRSKYLKSSNSANTNSNNNYSSINDTFKQPKNNLNRNTSTFIEKIVTADNYTKKMNNANSLLISAHGKVINIIILDENPKEIEVDPPALKIITSSNVITCFKTFQHILPSGEQDLDILFGFASGDILWLNPLKMKYSRWNKNGKIKHSIVTSIEWSKCGKFAIFGFADGTTLIFDRNLEDPETDNEPFVQRKEKYMKVYKSLITKHRIQSNPIAHYKFTTKPITSITRHPNYRNIIVLTSDDGFIRLFDLLSEKITDIIPSYYAGVLVSKFSLDGKFLFVGGEDDLVSVYEFQISNIFSVSNETGLIKLVTRLQGAKSWIKGIDIEQSESNPSLSYTIGTASDDGYIRFYEFQPRSLRKIKKHHNHTNGNHFSSPKLHMHRAFSEQQNSERRKMNRSDRINNTSLSSLNSGSNALSLLEVINNGSSSTSLYQLQQSSIQIKLGEGSRLQAPLSFEQERGKGESMTKNILFNYKSISPMSILFCDSKTKDPIIHKTAGMESIKTILPVSEKNVNLGRLSGLHMNKEYIWAFLSSGDLVRWKKHVV